MNNYNVIFFNFLIFGIVLLFIFLFTPFQKVLANSTTNFQISIIPGPQCYDGQDNDGDGLTDFPDDPGCDSQTDDNETDPVPEPFCGDNSCNGGEDCLSCPADCDVCNDDLQPVTSVTFSGLAYPKSKVTLLKDAQIVATTTAGKDAKFQIDLTGISSGSYIFSICNISNVNYKYDILSFIIRLQFNFRYHNQNYLCWINPIFNHFFSFYD